MNPEPLTRDDVLTAAEAAELLGLPRSTLYDYADRGLLPARQIGRRWIFRRSLLDAATLPANDPEAWTGRGSARPVRTPETAGRLPATVARS